MATDLGYERLKKAVATPGTTIAEIQAAVIMDMQDEEKATKLRHLKMCDNL